MGKAATVKKRRNAGMRTIRTCWTKTGGQTKSQPQPGWLRKEAVKLEAQWLWQDTGLEGCTRRNDQRCRSIVNRMICGQMGGRRQTMVYRRARLAALYTRAVLNCRVGWVDKRTLTYTSLSLALTVLAAATDQ